MKRTIFITAVLFFILVPALVACSNNALDEQASPSVDEGDPTAGEQVYTRACATCHGPKGEGVPGLSKDMTRSEFIADKTNQELVEFIELGGSPGEPLIMLPKAGNPALTQVNLNDVVAYLRTLQGQSIGLGRGED